MNEIVAFLAKSPADGEWCGWEISRINGSGNNILYRATGHGCDWAVKFTIRDERRRAWREFQALTVLQEAGLSIAPKPILLDESRCAQPVVVQSWLEGEVTAVPPQTDSEWHLLLDHYAVLATVSPQTTSVTMLEAGINFNGIKHGLQHIYAHLQMLPESHQPTILCQLIPAVEKMASTIEQEVEPVLGLCRVDGNTLNFVRRADQWLSVDWENCGWGDPAFEIVDLMCHPAYLDVPWPRWEWVMWQYAAKVGDETAVIRIQNTYPVLLVWWIIRLARFLYEVPRGKDERLVQRPDNWQDDIEQKMERYVERVTAVLSHLPGSFKTI